jgi:hypothetical protein
MASSPEGSAVVPSQRISTVVVVVVAPNVVDAVKFGSKLEEDTGGAVVTRMMVIVGA